MIKIFSSHLNWNFEDEIFFVMWVEVWPPVLDVCIAVLVLDTLKILNLTFLIVRLCSFQFQILFLNISDFSEFFLKFLCIIEKKFRIRYRPILLIDSRIFIWQMGMNFRNSISPIAQGNIFYFGEFLEIFLS